MRHIIFAGHQRSRRVHIDPVYDSRPHGAVNAGQFKAAVVHQSIDQRLAIVPGRWMHDHLLRLIDNDDILVFIEDVQRNVLRLDIRLFCLWKVYLYPVTQRKPVIGFYRLLVHSHMILFD